MTSTSTRKPVLKPSWPPAMSLDQPKVPVFPVACLPEPLRSWVEETAEATQTPPDLAALISLGVCAGAAARKVQVLAGPGWFEPINLYTVCLLEPGNRKSAVFSSAIKPLRELEKKLIAEAAAMIARDRTSRKIRQMKHDQLVKKAASGCDGAGDVEAEAVRIAEELDLEDAPVSPKLIVDDATPEAIGMILAQQGGSLMVAGAEGGLFDIMAGRYSGGAPNLDVFLDGHSGDTIKVDRVMRGSLVVDSPALTLAYAVQPDVIRGMVTNRAFRGRGLVGRFIYSVPISLLGSRKIAPKPVSEQTQAAYASMVLRLAEIDYDDEGKNHLIKLSKEARRLFQDWQHEIESDLGADGRFEMMKDWAGKLAGQTARMAAILHLASNDQAQPWLDAIDGKTMKAAIQIARWACDHAEVAIAMMANDDGAMEDARYILRGLRKRESQGELSTLEVTGRDVHNAGRRRFDRDRERLDRALSILVEYGWLKMAGKVSTGKSGRTSERYLIYPGLATGANWSEPKTDTAGPELPRTKASPARREKGVI